MAEIFRSVDLTSLQTLPQLTRRDREVLERLLWLAPDVAVSTAAAVLRAHLPELHAALFADRQRPEIGQLARALVYLGLAMAAPAQGKILPVLTREDLHQADRQVAERLARWSAASFLGAQELVAAETIPDPELRALLDALVERVSRHTNRDPRWLRAVVFGEAGTLYARLSQACREQFSRVVDLERANAHLERIARTRDLVVDALAAEETTARFDAAKKAEYIARLRRFGWEEFTASSGRTLRDIAAEAARHGLIARTSFALTDEWIAHGASQPTTGRRYFIRPALLPDSEGLALWAQEERLKPLQKMLAGDPRETGLRLGLGSVELFLEYIVRTGRVNFLDGRWTRTSNRFDGLQTRFGAVDGSGYAITIFPGARLDENVGICPVIEVLETAVSSSANLIDLTPT
ncbi:MAG TPA: hypothetical protein VKY56_05270 [Chloroflexota bacterium]|nr:hypothetical protein [Chloroflexota bacterium]